MNQELDMKHQNVKQYIIDSIEKLNQENGNIIGEDVLDMCVNVFTSEKYDSDSEASIYQEIDNTLEKMLVERDIRVQEQKREKNDELNRLYLNSKEKYGNLDYFVIGTIQNEHIRGYHETKEVKLLDSLGTVSYGFYKGYSSPNEYELLVSRLGKIWNVSVADYALSFDNNKLCGYSISSIQNKADYEYISGYDFVKTNPDVESIVYQILNNPYEAKPNFSCEETKHFIEVLFQGFTDRIHNTEQLNQIKKDYLKAVLWNLLLDLKDFNYTNFGVLHDRINDVYQLAPLFDNGSIKKNDMFEGTMVISLGRSKKDDILDLLFHDYYEFIHSFSEQLYLEYQKAVKGEDSMISRMMTCIGDTLISKEAEEYKIMVQSTLEKIIEQIQKKQNQ